MSARFAVVTLSALLGLTGPAAAEDRLPKPGEETRRAVIALLRENRQKYGDDAAIMQGLFLVHANQGGAILTTESAIVGFEERDRRRYVSFRVNSGTIFDDSTMDRDQRLEQIWRSILERTIARYPTFSVPGDGIVVEIQYSHRAYRSIDELYDTIEDIGVVETAKFYLLTSHLTEFIEHRFDARSLLEHSQVFLDGQRVHPVLHDFVGPPRPGDTPAGAAATTSSY